MDVLSKMSDRELSDIGLSRAGLYGVFASQTAQAPETSRQAGDEVEEQVLADLGLSRRFPFPAAGDRGQQSNETNPDHEQPLQTKKHTTKARLLAATAELSVTATPAHAEASRYNAPDHTHSHGARR